MKSLPFIRLVILLFYLIACANKNRSGAIYGNDIDTTVGAKPAFADTFQTGRVIAKVDCVADTTQSYALYLPPAGNGKPLPVIYFFDPHGDGSLPVTKYRALGDSYNFILIGSNNSKNGNEWPATENIWRVMYDDSQKRLKVNSNLVYVCGFSGGAKAAGYIGINHPEVKGVVANGAGLPDAASAANFNFSFTAIAGEGDMNMTDLVAFNSELDKTKTRHRLIFFDGKHEWAPERTMNTAFAGLRLDAMRGEQVPTDDSFIIHFNGDSKKRIEDYLKRDRLVRAVEECKLSINMLSGLSNQLDWFKEKESSIENDPAYQKQKLAEQNLLATEQNLKATYSRQFQDGDINYWIKTIKDLQSRCKAATEEGGIYQRLMAYLSLAFYSISNQLISRNENKDAGHFVTLYKMADATNSEAWYFSALLNARNNNAKAAEADLLKAVAFGFKDKARMVQQPEFEKLAAHINFPEIERKMDNGK